MLGVVMEERRRPRNSISRFDKIIEINQILNYLKEHPGIYSDFTIEMIQKYLISNQKDKFVPDSIRELYDECGLLTEEQDIYTGFLELLQSEYDIREKKMIEVGGGVIPRLGKRISSIQTGEGKITVYDPRLSKYEKSTDRMKLVRKPFTYETPLKDTNFLLAFMPCEAAETFINMATSHQIDFMIALCEGGPHGDEFDYFDSEEEWIHSMIYLAKRGIKDHHMGTLGIQYLKKYEDPYPVLYNHR